MNTAGHAHVKYPLSKSNNIFNDTKTKNKLLAGAFGLYVFTFLPLMGGLIAERHTNLISEFFLKYPATMFASFGITLFTGFILGFSRIATRKFPLNYLLYFVFLVRLTFFGMSASQDDSSPNLYVLFVMIVSVGICFMVYSITATGDFKGYFAIMISTGVLLINMISFGLLHSYKRPYIIAYFAISMVISLMIAFGSQEIVANKSYELLRHDYVYVALKLVTLFPLIPHLTGDREEYALEE